MARRRKSKNQRVGNYRHEEAMRKSNPAGDELY